MMSTFLIILVFSIFCSVNAGVLDAPILACNTSTYEAWKLETYLGTLATDPNFWRYQGKTQFVLTKGLALELVVAKCKTKFTVLQKFKAGRMGPITIQSGYKAMCSSYCLETDRLSQEALQRSGCSCLQLSTQPGSAFYQSPGDWCRRNTGRLLCDILGYCGVWECRIDDFMCPRYEFNKRYISLKGPGTCIRNASSPSFSMSLGLLVSMILTVMFTFL